MDITLIRDSPTGNITGAVFYTYNPSLPAAYIFMASFGILTLAHLIYMFPLRTWYFINFILGGLCETMGYYGRSMSHDKVSETGAWMLQNVMILGAPTFLAATVYMTLARLTIALGAEEYSMISPRWLTKLYICIDILCFLSQFCGAGVQASGNQQVISIGNKVIFGGLVFQLVAFVFFLVMAWKVSVRYRKSQESNPTDRYQAQGWRKYFRGLYVASVLFIIRNLVRTVEYGQIAVGGGGFSFASRDADGTLHYEEKRTKKIGDHEALLYVFDSAMMVGLMITFLVLHPGRFIKRARNMQGEKLGSVELRGLTAGQ